MDLIYLQGKTLEAKGQSMKLILATLLLSLIKAKLMALNILLYKSGKILVLIDLILLQLSKPGNCILHIQEIFLSKMQLLIKISFSQLKMSI
jgi:hypothetical protein